MDATMMVVASVPTPVNGTPVKDNSSGGKGESSAFCQLLAGNLSQDNSNGGQLTNLANLATGAGQLNQILAQIVARLNSQTPVQGVKETEKQDNSGNQKKLNLPQEVLNALMTLLQTLQTVTEPVQDSVENITDNGSKTPNLQMVLDSLTSQEGIKGQVGVELQKIITEATSLGDFTAKLEGLLDQISAKSEKEPGIKGVVEKLSRFIDEIKKLVTDTPQSPTQVNSRQDTKADKGFPVNATPTESPKEQDGQNTALKEATSQRTIGQNIVAQNESLKTENPKSNQSNQSNQLKTEDKATPYFNNTVNTVTAQDTPKVSSTANVSRYADSIFNQIVEKAHIALGDGQSEMKIQLQPDFLGKVNMQIKVEEGVITAKFAAENMQVKQLIEANLNNLRQNLADQGFNVQQLQVTIGQQKDFNSYQPRQGQTGTNKGKSKSGSEGDLDVIEAVTTNELQKEIAQQYGINESDYDYVV